MSNDKPFKFSDGVFLGFYLGVIGLMFVLWVAGFLQEAQGLRKEAIERGYAQYNGKTGKWQWNEESP